MRRRVIHASVLTLALAAGACGVENPVGVSRSPFIAQVAGVFTGPLTLAGVGGGECVGDLLRTEIGAAALGTVSIAQKGSDVTATLTSDDTGLSCRYSGTAGTGTLAFSDAACEAKTIIYRCSNGAVRDARVAGSSITAQTNGPIVDGVVTTFYNLFEYRELAGSTTERPVAGMVTTSNFTAVRR